MLRHLLALACLVALASSAPLVLASTGSMAGAAQARANTLLPGHVLRWDRNHEELHSSNQRFHVRMQPSGFKIDGGIDYLSTTTWSRNGDYRGPEDRTHLTMQRDGNLVLRHGNGDLIWQTGTRGSGNQLMITNTGNLVVRSAAGAAKWQSYTTTTVMGPGDTLASGLRLVLHGADGFPTVRLVMTTTGDLVLSANGRLRWHSNTRVAGSSARITTSGALAILCPHGNVRWHTPPFGRHAYLHITQDARIVVGSTDRRPCWQHPAPGPGFGCTSG